MTVEPIERDLLIHQIHKTVCNDIQHAVFSIKSDIRTICLVGVGTFCALIVDIALRVF